jgi:transcriptional regulator with XRE-family HTH domain
MDLGGTIRKYRLLNNLKQSELAKMLNVTTQAVSSWEVNRTEPKMETIEQLCKIFNCQKSDFLEDSPRSFDSPEEFEFQWQEIGGGKHPIELNDDESRLINGYRMLKESDKVMIKRLIRLLIYSRIFNKQDI